ncbi:membrane protein, partial [Paenibacillus larvae]|nr:membrane protein [Paenibacillus larvae]
MYKRIIVAVAGALFTLLALLAAIITDLYDRDFPQAIGVESRLSLNFSESGFSVTEAFATLEELDARWDLGLVKVAPDLDRDGDGQIFVALNDGDLPAEFTWFGGDGVGKIVGKDRLAASYPNGFYLVTGENAHLGEFEDA